MRLLFLSSLVPMAEPASGFDIANRAIVDVLRAEGHRVTSVGFAPPARAPAYPDGTVLLDTIELTNAHVGKRQKAIWLARALSYRTTFAAAKMRVLSDATIRARLASQPQPDAVILNSVQLAAAYPDLFAELPAIYLAHNVEHQSARQNSVTAQSAIERLLFRREARLLENQERALVKRARHVWTLSEDDRAVLAGASPEKASVLPLVTRLAPEATSLQGAKPPLYDIGLIGTWSWEPNRVGLQWFLEDVAPRLPSDVTIAIAGTIAKPIGSRHPNVQYLGRVPSAQAFVRSVGVVPLASRGGTGVQLKTIETFEMGLPCVATPSAVRGVARVPENCRVESDAAGFADALKQSVDRVRSGDRMTVDGSVFHQRQLASLKAEIARTLSAILI
jgi:hypothetical protein